MPPLENEKHEIFCNHVLTGSAKDAALALGYSARNAKELMKRLEVRERIAELAAERLARLKIDQDYVARNCLEIIERSMGRLPVRDHKGNLVHRWDTDAAMRALALLSKHTGGFNDTHNVRFPDGASFGVLAVPMQPPPDQWAQLAVSHQAALANRSPTSSPLPS